jgi:hypothetical protein
MRRTADPSPAPPGAVVEVVQSIAGIDAADWDACAGQDNPFVGHAFLSTLEDSGSVGAESGWQPVHLVMRGEGGRLDGAVPLYLKSHSHGEYVFDHGWAQAWEHAGGRYYPKLQAAVPFTPVPGPRLLARPGADTATTRWRLIEGLIGFAERLAVSSLHVTFPTREEWDLMGEAGFLKRLGTQFHWENRGYRDFDDFLAALSSRKRKVIRKERAEVAATGIRLRTLSGDEIRPRHWDAFFRFYIDTGSRKWGSPYLTREFFHLLGERLGDRVVLVLAEADGKPVAGALNLRGQDALYGRNWGAMVDAKFLHFEACYYQAIEYAIAQGLARVEAGAQGPHKIARGYLPVPTYSAHWIAHPGFRRAVADAVEVERREVEHEAAELATLTPYRLGD